MTDSLIAQLSYVGIPILALVGFGLMVSWWQMSASVRSMFQHLAAGVITSAVAVELLPSMLNAGSVSGLSAGYLAGVASMVFLERLAERMGTLVPVAVDLCIDGFLLMIGFATGEKGGLLLLLGLTLETASLGSVMGSALSAQGKTRIHLLAILLGLGVCVLGGAGFGMLFPAETGFLFAGVLGFGVAALLYLAVEELLTEAHETEDTPFTTAIFFGGFLVPLLLAQVNS